MNKTIKSTLIAGAILVCIGLVIIIAVGFASKWNFATIDWEEKVYECNNVEIAYINYEFSAGTLKVEYYEGDVIKVEYPHSNEFTTEFSISHTALNIATTQVRWYNTGFWFNKIPETRVYLPRNVIFGLDLEINAGVVEIGEGQYSKIDVEMNAGTISIDNVASSVFSLELNAGAVNLTRITSGEFAADINAGSLNLKGLKCDKINLEISAGSANISVVGKKSDYTIVADVSAGSCNVTNQLGVHYNKTLSVEVSAGSANITFEG